VKKSIAHIKGLITCPIAQRVIIKELIQSNFGSWYYQDNMGHHKVGRNCAFTASRIVCEAFLHRQLTVRKVRCKRSEMKKQERTWKNTMEYLIEYGFMVVENNRSRLRADFFKKVDESRILAAATEEE
jgi:hypothetical protein